MSLRFIPATSLLSASDALHLKCARPGEDVLDEMRDYAPDLSRIIDWKTGKRSHAEGD